MNKWTKKSFALAYEEHYLDNLSHIYIMYDNDIRVLDPNIKIALKEAFDTRDDYKLIKLLLKLDKFPIKDSYKPFFTRCNKNEADYLLKSNPITVARLAKRIYDNGFEKTILGIEEPIETNRQMGPMFPNWIRQSYPCFNNFEEFFNSSNPISVLSGSDEQLVSFTKNYLNVVLPTGTKGTAKGLDAVIKINTSPIATYVIGEAKFLSDEGGHQNAQLKDALHLLTSSDFKNNGKFRVIRLAILDGVCWLNSKRKMQEELRSLTDDQIAISALLLNEFFNEILLT